MNGGVFGQRDEWLSLLKRADLLQDIQRYEQALQVLLRAQAIGPDDPKVNCELAFTYFCLKNHEKALEHAEAAIRSAPQSEWAHRLRSCSLYRMGRMREALDSAIESAKLSPEGHHTLDNLFEVQRGLKMYEEAQKTAERMIELFPDSPDSHMNLGLLCLRPFHYAEAEAHFRRQLALAPNDYYALVNLGVALQFQGRLEEAADVLRSAVAVSPADPAARDRLLQVEAEMMERRAAESPRRVSAPQRGGEREAPGWARVAIAVMFVGAMVICSAIRRSNPPAPEIRVPPPIDMKSLVPTRTFTPEINIPSYRPYLPPSLPPDWLDKLPKRSFGYDKPLVGDELWRDETEDDQLEPYNFDEEDEEEKVYDEDEFEDVEEPVEETKKPLEEEPLLPPPFPDPQPD